MSSQEDDDDLALAIALSLQERSPPSSDQMPQEIINLISDSEDEEDDDDLDKPAGPKQPSVLVPRNAVESIPMQDSTSGDSKARMAAPRSHSSLHMPSSTAEVTTGILNLLDRRQMEEQRLARANKRKLSASPRHGSSIVGQERPMKKQNVVTLRIS